MTPPCKELELLSRKDTAGIASLVYTAESRALATLEVSVYLDLSEDLPTDQYYVPDDVEILQLSTEDLPENWDAKPPILETQFIGNDFVKEATAAVLKIPSCIIPPEFNYLINPNHPDAKKTRVISKVPLTFDQMMKQAGNE